MFTKRKKGFVYYKGRKKRFNHLKHGIKEQKYCGRPMQHNFKRIQGSASLSNGSSQIM